MTIGLSFKMRVVTVGLALERINQRNDKVVLLYDVTGKYGFVLACSVVEGALFCLRIWANCNE